jgi:hypothetical protein
MTSSLSTEDYYTVLELNQNATREEIVKSYKRLALKRHPDRNMEKDATEAFQLVCLFFRSKLVPLSIIENAVLTPDIEAWTSLRDVEG